jgi:hypothetical protein
MLLPTLSIFPSRIRTVAESSVCPGLTTTLAPTSAWTPSGCGRNPGGNKSSASARTTAMPAHAASAKVNLNLEFMGLVICGCCGYIALDALHFTL